MRKYTHLMWRPLGPSGQFRWSAHGGTLHGCLWCGRTWYDAERHTIQFTETRGMFPACEACWPILTLQQRLDVAGRLMDIWEAQGDPNVPRVAVDEYIVSTWASRGDDS